ncbi:MAG TPA: hypothetical protein ENL34_03170 [Chloroflexi bacterium]|nr:hypothetical protein [Chloroflexota bacterium]
MVETALFTMSGVAWPEGADPLGLWQVEPQLERAFDTRSAVDDRLVWSVALPGDHQLAQVQIAARLQKVTQVQARLEDAERKLGTLSVGTPFAHDQDTAAAALLTEVLVIQQGRTAMASGIDPQRWVDLYHEATALLRQFRRLLLYYGWVETEIAGEFVGLTTIDWSSDYQTAWQDGITADGMRLHLDAVRLALASRQALDRLVTVIVTGALELAVKAGIPGGHVLLLPAVYRYVRTILQQLQELERVS